MSTTPPKCGIFNAIRLPHRNFHDNQHSPAQDCIKLIKNANRLNANNSGHTLPAADRCWHRDWPRIYGQQLSRPEAGVFPLDHGDASDCAMGGVPSTLDNVVEQSPSVGRQCRPSAHKSYKRLITQTSAGEPPDDGRTTSGGGNSIHSAHPQRVKSPVESVAATSAARDFVLPPPPFMAY